MKIKFLLFAIIFAFGAMLVSTKAVLDGGNTGGGIVIDSKVLRMGLSSPKVVQTAGLNFNFNVDQGIVDVVIRDGNGSVVHTQSVNTSSIKTLHIDTFGFDAGRYSISVTDANGNTLSNHSFEIE